MPIVWLPARSRSFLINPSCFCQVPLCSNLHFFIARSQFASHNVVANAKVMFGTWSFASLSPSPTLTSQGLGLNHGRRHSALNPRSSELRDRRVHSAGAGSTSSDDSGAEGRTNVRPGDWCVGQSHLLKVEGGLRDRGARGQRFGWLTLTLQSGLPP